MLGVIDMEINKNENEWFLKCVCMWLPLFQTALSNDEIIIDIGDTPTRCQKKTGTKKSKELFQRTHVERKRE